MSLLSNVLISTASGAAAAGIVSMVSFVELQAATPGTAQTGHMNITGYSLAGRVGVGTSPVLARVQVSESGALQGVRSITGTGVAVYGQSNATTGLGAGGYFTSASSGGRALVVDQLNASGNTVGGLFYTHSPTGISVWGKNTATTGAGAGLFGESASAEGFGVKASNTTNDGAAILATNNSGTTGRATIVANNTKASGSWGRSFEGSGGGTSGDCSFFDASMAGASFNYAIKAHSNGTNGRGIFAYASEGTGTNYGVYGQSASGTNGYGVFSDGNTGASGTKSMVIDNPMDPQNSILKQYCAEGAEPLMVYSGTVSLTSAGQATVTLPEYFESIAKDPRFSLTAFGKPMPNLYVVDTVQNHQFRIAGGVAGGKVCWTVTATRNDPWVKAHGAKTLIAKSATERGRYISPQLYGKPQSAQMGIQPAEREARLAAERAAQGSPRPN